MTFQLTYTTRLVLLLLGARIGSVPSPPDPVTAFVDVNLVDVDGGKVIPHQTVVIRDGRILSTNDAGRTTVPAGAVRIEGAGRFLAPGLADMHVHATDVELPLFLANGVTTIREMNGSPSHLRWRREIADGTRVGPTMIVTGPLLAGTAQRYRHMLITTPEQAKTVVLAEADSGYEFIKIYDDLSLAVYDAIVQAAAARKILTTGHIPAALGLAGVLSHGQYSIEHTNQILQAVGDHAADSAAVDSAVAQIARSSSWVTPTLASLEALTLTGSPEIWRAFNAPEVAYVDADTRQWWRSIRRGDQPSGVSPRAELRMVLLRRLVKGLAQRNVRILVGTDTPNPLMVPGFSLHLELAALERAGMSRAEVLRAATANAAAFMGQTGEFGVVRVGARADLLLVDRNPLEDLAGLRRPAGVMVRGHWLPRDTLDQMLEGVWKQLESATAN